MLNNPEGDTDVLVISFFKEENENDVIGASKRPHKNLDSQREYVIDGMTLSLFFSHKKTK